jgi:hypothetical protein
MRTFLKVTTLGLCAVAMYCVDTSHNATGGIGFIAQAQAIVGRPATPVSYAGVARRTTYRAAETAAVVATTAAVSSTTVVVATPSTTSVAVGTTVTTLPGGCVATTVGTIQYQQCGTVYYKPAYQGNNLVYIVSIP